VQEWANKRFKNPEHAKAFSRWFGKSKVVDDKGHPLVVYHGTPTPGFNQFDARHAGRNTRNEAKDVGHHFTDSVKTAEYYSEASGVAPQSAIMPVYLRMKNPYMLADPVINADDIAFAKGMEHDGIITKMHGGKSREFVVFDSTQIKSATGNRGTFSKKHGNINLSIDAIPTLNINRTYNPHSEPTPPETPNADELADETLRYLAGLYQEIEDALVAGQPLGFVSAKLDKLVAQAELSSWIAGAVAVWGESREPKLITLDSQGPLQKNRFPWVETAARWLMDRDVYSAEEIQQQTRGQELPRWKSLEAVTRLRDEIAFGFPSGESFNEFYTRIKGVVDATKPELQNAFRTSTHQAFIHGSTTTLEKPIVKTQFPYVLFHSAHDTRTRATHRPLDGLLFEVGGEAYSIAKKALNDFNCRCSIISYTEAKRQRKQLQVIEVDQLPPEVLAKYS
jgi:hypothetical protein